VANFAVAQSIATFVALTSNFFLNNELTYRDRRLNGLAMFGGFLGFCAIGAVGALTNVGLAAWLYSERSVWWVAGAAGAIMGALWNYALSSLFVWRTR
jgi:dolichol-phosphate mannosyltransferase